MIRVGVAVGFEPSRLVGRSGVSHGIESRKERVSITNQRVRKHEGVQSREVELDLVVCSGRINARRNVLVARV